MPKSLTPKEAWNYFCEVYEHVSNVGMVSPRIDECLDAVQNYLMVKPMTFAGRECYFCVITPNDIIRCSTGKDLELLLNDPRVTVYQPQQIKIEVVYK